MTKVWDGPVTYNFSTAQFYGLEQRFNQEVKRVWGGISISSTVFLLAVYDKFFYKKKLLSIWSMQLESGSWCRLETNYVKAGASDNTSNTELFFLFAQSLYSGWMENSVKGLEEESLGTKVLITSTVHVLSIFKKGYVDFNWVNTSKFTKDTVQLAK